jgi:hypothetical protein
MTNRRVQLAAAIFTVAAGAFLPAARAADNPAETIAHTMLQNLQQNGFDSDPRVNDGLGGLWINWRTGSRPLLVDFNGSGEPDKTGVPRHDPLTDFRYLHNLLSWKHQHPQDTQFDGELARYTAIVKHEFANSRDQRGWLYDELMDMWRLSGDEFYRDTARGLAANFAKEIDAKTGAIFKTRDSNPHGYYRVDNTLEAGCALVMAGTQFHNPDWTVKGNRLVQFVYDHAWLRDSHIFLNMMDEVRLPDGTANPNEKIYREPYHNYEVDGGVVRFGSVGQEAFSLLHAYIVTSDKIYLDRANELLGPLTAKQNLLGLWDEKHGGYFNGVEFGGPSFEDPGKPKLLDEKKESGRQFHMLQAFHVADRLTGGDYAGMESAMLDVLLNKAYYKEGQGIVYEMAPDWSLLKLKHGGVEDWVTSEAMGCSMLAIFSMNEKDPW